jgi:hypothetical protein
MSLNTSTRYGRPIVRRYAGLVPTDTLDVASVVVESEAHDMRTQRIGLAGWSDQAQRPLDAPASVLDYLSFGPSFHQTFWELGQRGVTHLHFRVTPLTKDKPATLTAIILRGRALSGPHKAKRQLRRQDVCSSSGVMTPRLAASQRSTSRACTTPTTFPASERTTS